MLDFSPDFATQLPETYRLLTAGNFILHPAVTRVALGGSRGLPRPFHRDHPGKTPRPDSDIDLTLILDRNTLPRGPELAGFLETVLRTTLDAWDGPVELDLAAAFDDQGCGLKCYGRAGFDPSTCFGSSTRLGSGVDCIGLYKIQRGFNGFVPAFGVRVDLMNPTMVIWHRGV